MQVLAGKVIGDRYRVKRVIGEGGMGVVYEAEHLSLGRVVAVKVLHPKRAQDREAISRLRHEARVAGTLGHPNICAIHDMGRLDDGSPYLVMERLFGETLAQRLQSDGTLPVEDLVDIMLQVLSALAAAHQRGVVHRDLKPDNIFLSRREGMAPIPKLLDFGISKAEDIEETMDVTGTAAGTPFYMAPEQARGERTLDHRVDLWAVGVILYECLTGQRPFVANNYNALLVKILSAPHRHVRELAPRAPIGLCRIIDKALSKDPNDRYQSAGELQIALRAVADADMAPLSVRAIDNAPLTARTPESAPHGLTQGESAPRSVRRPMPVPMPMPRVIDEPTNDDTDSTFVFSRFDLNALEGAEAEEGSDTFDDDEKTRVYVPFSDDDDRTVVDPPSFLKKPGPPDPKQKS